VLLRLFCGLSTHVLQSEDRSFLGSGGAGRRFEQSRAAESFQGVGNMFLSFFFGSEGCGGALILDALTEAFDHPISHSTISEISQASDLVSKLGR
jgi:hypothetical protein